MTEKLPDTFAIYLVKNLMAVKGYQPGTVPEAAALIDACDYALTYDDGYMLRMACVIDGERKSGRSFDLSCERLQAIGEACTKYTGKIGGNKMPAVIELIETGGAGFIEMRREELKSPPKIDPHTGFNRYAIDVADKKVASNLPFNTFLGNGRFISRLLRTPRMEDAELYKAAAPSVFAQPTYPWLTATLLGVIGVIFGLELLYALQPPQGLLGLDTRTLLAFGALNRQLVEYGEWWRLFSYAFLHGNLFHIAFNGVAIYCAGQILENMLGRRWYAAVYSVGAVAGALASILFNSDATVSVGASGAVMALFVMIFMCSRRFPPGPDRAKIQMNAMSVLIPSMLPVMFIGINVDLAAHAGGAIAGLIMGGIIFAFWRKEQPHPPFKVLAGLICAGGAFACFYAFQAVLKGFSAFQAL